jgi:hypothetical protein
MSRTGLAVLVLLAAAAAVAATWLPRIPQDPAYHGFADQRALLGIPHALNVLSNLPLALAGVYGAGRLRRLALPQHAAGGAVVSAAAVLAAAGSAWYHLAPSTAGLALDRLPIAAGFMALLALVIGDRVSARAGYVALWPLVAAGIGTVVYWYWSETAGRGDLRPYAVAQFLPLILIPLLLLATRPAALRAQWLWGTLLSYALAKIAEHLDWPIFQITDALISGHTLKHLFAALAVLCALLALPVRAISGPSRAAHR